MTHNYPNLFAISATRCHWWRRWESASYGVTVGHYPFDSRFEAVVDDFGTLTPVRRYG